MPLRTLPWLPAALAITAGMLAATLLWQFDVVGPFGVVGLFSLAGEQTVAVWWSTLLLTLAALACFGQAHEARAGRWAWAVLAAVLVILSWDEAGSLHERAFRGDEASDQARNLVGGLLGLSTFVAVARLLALRQARRSGVFFFIAFGLLATVPVQEWLEHNSTIAERFGPARVLIEEGTELSAAILLLAACAAARPAPWRLGALLPKAEAFAALRLPLALLLVPAALACLAWMPHLPDLTFRGNPGLWYPAAVLTVIGAALMGEGRDAMGVAVAAASALLFVLLPDALAFNGQVCLALGLAAFGAYELARAGLQKISSPARGGNFSLDHS